MSVKPFETFLVELFLGKAGDVIEAGSRYQFKSPDSANSIRLFQALVAQKSGDIVNEHGISLPYIQLSGCKVVPVMQSEEPHESQGFTENYISFLRDEVSKLGGCLKDCALVIIHNSLLDTVISAVGDLSQPEQVWSTKSIKQALTGLIDQQDNRRAVSLCLLDDQFDAILDDGATMFGFEALYNAVQDGDLRFDELGMLNDPQIALYEGQPAQLRRRLAENRSLYEELSFEVEHFGEQLEDRLKSFGEKFIREHFSDVDSWKKVDFQAYLNEIKRNSVQQLMLENEQGSAGMVITARNKSESKAGMRDRHIIIELDAGVDDYELKLSFSGANNLDKSQFSLKSAKGCKVEHQIGTRNNALSGCSATLKAKYQQAPQFFTLKLDRENKSEGYNFRCLVLRKGEFFIEPIKSLFLVEPSKLRLTLNMDENKLPISQTSTQQVSLTDAKQVVNNGDYGVVDFEDLANESDEIDFTIQSGENSLCFNVEGAVATDSLSLPLLLNRDRFHKLFNDDYNGELLYQKGKVNLDNSEFVVPARRIKLLRWEQDFVTNRSVALFDSQSIDVAQLIAVDDGLHSAYQLLFDYLSERKTTLSLASWGAELSGIVSQLVDAFLRFFEAIPKGGMLSQTQKLALKIGIVNLDGEEYYSPYHPLLLAYNLYLCQTMQQDKSFKSLPDVTFERLSATGLLPYVFHPTHGFAYNQRVKENAFWLRSVPQEKSSLTFVRKLVKEKLDEFQLAFEKLFSGSESSILVNAVNQDAAHELFLGLVDYIRTNMDKSAAIHVNLYDDDLSFNAFDRFAETGNYDELKEWLELNKGKARETADTVIDLLRTRLTYSKFTNAQAESTGQAYAHLTFFRNNNKVDCTSIAIDSMVSGIACDGLLSGEASKSDNGSYLTGFGLKGVEYNTLPHLKMAKYIGSLIKPALQPNTPYQGTDAVVIAVNEDFKTLLKRSYQSSIWTTIIDPKVTLDFFHSNDDVVLIHYSDQYTISASYDAITVTAQTELFERVIQQDEGGRLNEFNAFNGDWLLKMMTCTAKVNKERKGIIGAYKFIVSLLHQSDITWVPLSVGEMIRVAGNIGLSISESDFSCKLNGYVKGAISDDVLLVGLKAQQMYLLPLEVKTGATPNYQKAITQAKALVRYMTEDILGNRTVAGKLHRGLFMRQVLMQIDKYRLYNVFNSGYFDALLEDKERWLKGDYELAGIADYPQGFVVSHLESDAIFEPDYQLVDGILRIDLPMAMLKTLVETPLQGLLSTTDIAKLCHVPPKYMLTNGTKAIALESAAEQAVTTDGVKQHQVECQNDAHDEDGHSKVKVDAHSQPASAGLSSVSLSVPARAATSSGNLSVLFGNNATTEAPLHWEPTNTAKFMNTNTGIIGTMGTGKTQFTKSVITQLHRNQADNVNGAPIGMLIFDYKSDYVDDKFIEATQAKKYKLHKLPYNPLSLYGDTPMLPVHTARGFSETMGKAFNLGQKQQLRLRKLVGEAYELAGIHKADSSTWHKAAPTIADVWELFIETEPDEDSLYAALESLYELEIFEDDNSQCMSLYELVSGITVVELAGYPSEVQNLVVALTLDLFYSQMQKHGKPEVVGDYRQISKLILVDEADNFMSQNFPSLRKILKEGREYGVGVVLSTQDITHFQTGENDYSSYVMTWVVHRVAKIKPQDIKAIFSVNEKAEQERLMETINKLEKHYSLYIDGAKKLQKMRDRAFWELLNDTQ
ncbi:DNA phosphorothioation-dependent restriction protein DptH [Shewanella algae]|uniref:DNA phosphorothioation-dependent restriction protein DptH n=1 Tax=Shewanella algae TaxID=38313 RepID=UPI0030042285